MENVIASTFDTTTIEGQIKAFNAQNGSATSMKEMEEEQVVTVTDILIHKDEIDQYGKIEEAEITTLYTEGEDGVVTLFASISATVGKSAKALVPLLEQIEKLNVKVVKSQSKQGQTFLNLQLVQ